MTKKITVIGGAGHIGLPLSVLFANSGIYVNCYDKNELLINKCKKGIFPYKEKFGSSNLKKSIKSLIKWPFVYIKLYLMLKNIN